MQFTRETSASESRAVLSEDWWSTLIGLCIVCIFLGLSLTGRDLGLAAVKPEPWTRFPDLAGQLVRDWPGYVLQFLALLVLFATAARAMNQPLVPFAVGFALVYVLAFAALAIGAWQAIRAYNVEPPLIALAIGAAIANLLPLPFGPREAFRVEFYIKTGIVLLGATFPVTLFLWTGPVAIAQASIVSLVTFATIYATARFLDLERELAALLAVGGAVCGVAAVIAVGGAIRARRENMSIALASVVGWSIVLIFVMPLLARAWYLSGGVAGAWIGTSELADAAGFLAAHAYGGLMRDSDAKGTPDQVLWSYTLLKVVGRDMWIGIWALVLSFVAMTRWSPASEWQHIGPMDIWHRFPKFIVGLFAASLLAAWVAGPIRYSELETAAGPAFLAPLVNLRVWIFSFSFLSIGLTTRLRGFAPVGGNAFLSFATGVLVNLVVGFVLSALVFAGYWDTIGR